LYLRLLPHQHSSLAAGSTAGGCGVERTIKGYGVLRRSEVFGLRRQSYEEE
jgi:hypothetical protein